MSPRLTPHEMAGRVGHRFPDPAVARGETTVVVDRGEVSGALGWLREEPDLGLDLLSSITATDHPGRPLRFWVAYELYSIRHRHRLRVKAGVPGDDPRLPTATSLFPTANWHEREVYDLFGVVFEGHPDLTRILLPDEWEGFPLRKDAGLGGVTTRYKHGAFIPPVDRRLDS